MSSPLPPPSSIPPAPPPPLPANAPAPAPRPRRPMVVVLGVIVLLAGAVGAFFALRGGDDTSKGGGAPPMLDEAAPIISSMVENAVFEGTDTAAPFDKCPVNFGMLLRKAPPESGIADFVGLDPFAGAIRPKGSSITLGECSVDEGGLVGFSFAGSPGKEQHEAALRSYLPDYDIQFDATRSWHGGTLFVYCATPSPDAPEGFSEFCEADWLNADVVVGVFSSPELATPAQLEEWLGSSLDWAIGQFLGV